jgi:hypothetical protein
LKGGQNIESAVSIECDDGTAFMLVEDHEVGAKMTEMSHHSTHRVSSPLPSDTMLSTPSKSAENMRMESKNTIHEKTTLRENSMEENLREDHTLKDGPAQLLFNSGIAKDLLLGRDGSNTNAKLQSGRLLLWRQG